MPKLERWVLPRFFCRKTRGVSLGPHAASLLRLWLNGNNSIAKLPRGLMHAPLSLLYLPSGLVPGSGGVDAVGEVKDFSLFRSFLSLHGTLPPLCERGAFHALPPCLQETIVGFLLVNGRRRGDGMRRLVPRGVDWIIVRALVDLEREERERMWAEDDLGLWWEGRVELRRGGRTKGVSVCRAMGRRGLLGVARSVWPEASGLRAAGEEIRGGRHLSRVLSRSRASRVVLDVEAGGGA